ncbi:hypothetical protein GCM10027046_10910 [Uliginosibacterium flavum]|uniref:Predicted 3'-5' exonuclease PolB-like domain-containing protein n=1 Tax=Uliginosibacterium flavum TaxID=1396831 RepID=A0ABV2TPT7_9RHOO
MVKPTLTFSLVTVPDVVGLRRLHGLPTDLSDEEVAEYAYQRRRANGAGDSLPPHQQRVVHIAALLRTGDQLRYVSLAGDEADILQAFNALLAEAEQLVEWSRPFGLEVLSAAPILNCRALLWQLAAVPELPMIDLAACLAAPLAPAMLPLHEMATLARLPLRQEMSLDEIWQTFMGGDRERIDVLNTARLLSLHLLWLRYGLLKGQLDSAACLQEFALLRQTLQNSPLAHLQAYLADWSAASD